MAEALARLSEITAYFQDHPDKLEAGAVNLEVKETHISFVLLSRDRVYKFKKAVRFAFIDQESLEERRLNCRREVELNRRLASDVYLGVYGVFARGEGFVLEEAGTAHPDALEYCVVMRRLPDERNLKSLLERGAVEPDHVTRIARAIGDFHVACERGPAVTGRRDFRGFLAEDLTVLAESGRAKAELIDGVRATLKNDSLALDRREARDMIVDGHGDLRLDHIYVLEEGIRIIDCVEFNPSLRAVDPYEDLAFTTMALKVEGREDLANRLTAEYAAWTADLPGLRLLPLYEIYRASVRAKIDWFMLQQAVPEKQEYFQRRFSRYLEFMELRLSAKNAREAKNTAGPGDMNESHRPAISVALGLPATGKSRHARRLQGTGAIPILSSDVIRKRMRRLNPVQNAGTEAFAGAYDPAATDLVYRRMLALARLAIGAGFDVILDATFGKARYRRMVATLARKTGAKLTFYHVRASEDEVRRRLERRRERGKVSDLVDFDIWREMAARFEEPGAEELKDASLVELTSPAGP